MNPRFRILLFGKPGCDKCAVLRRRLEHLLAEPGWQDFEMVYMDTETIEGLVAFCRAECINPNRLPAFLVMERDGGADGWRPIPRATTDGLPHPSRLYAYVGLQTDYSEEGRGVITPAAIRAELEEARRLASAPSS